METNISYGSAENTHLEGITVHLGDTSLCALDSMTVRDVNLPSPAVMSKWMNLTEEPSDSEALALLGDLFMSTGKPMIGEFTMSGLKLTIPSGENVTLGTFRIANPKVDPFTVDVAAEHLVLPLSIDPQLQLLRLTGLQNMDLTTTFSFSGLNASDLFRAAYSLNMAGAGTLDMGFEGSLPAAEWKAAVEKWKAVDAAQTGADKVDPDAASGDIMETLLREHLMLVNMEIGYADEGLLPRGIKLAQISMGLSTEQCLELIRQQIVMTTMGMGSQIPDAAARLNEFIDHPGAVRLTVRPEKPVRIHGHRKRRRRSPDQARSDPRAEDDRRTRRRPEIISGARLQAGRAPSAFSRNVRVPLFRMLPRSAGSDTQAGRGLWLRQ